MLGLSLAGPCRAVDPLPDLVVTHVDVAGLERTCPNGRVSGTVQVTVANVGSADVAVTVRVAVFEDRDQDGTLTSGPGSSDAVLGEAAVAPPLAVDASQTVDVVVDGWLTFAGNFVTAFVDSEGDVAELAEDQDNARRRGLTDGPASPPPGIAGVLKWRALQGQDSSMTPVVASLTDDDGDGVVDERDVPDVLVVTRLTGNQDDGSIIQAVSGVGGDLLFASDPAHPVVAYAELAVGDLDGDGLPEVVACRKEGNGLHVFDHELRHVDTTDVLTLPGANPHVKSGPVIANLDSQGAPEIVAGSVVFFADGTQVPGSGGEPDGTNKDYAAHATVADIDLDGQPELVAGPSVRRMTSSGQVVLAWSQLSATHPDGYAAVANLDETMPGGDREAEIVVVGSRKLYVLSHLGETEPWFNGGVPVGLPGLSVDRGGPPTIDNLDGAGSPEIVVSTRNVVQAYRATGGSPYWQHAIADNSSSAGSSTFDFDGDGLPEVVHRDEDELAVLDGTTGTTRCRCG